MAKIKLKDATIDQIGRKVYNTPAKWGLHEWCRASTDCALHHFQKSLKKLKHSV